MNNKNDKFKDFLGRNRAAALGVAVAVALGGSVLGYAAIHDNDEDDNSNYASSGSGYYGGGYHGGVYFFTRGSSYRSGTWSKSSTFSGKSYTSSRGGSIGG